MDEKLWMEFPRGDLRSWVRGNVIQDRPSLRKENSVPSETAASPSIQRAGSGPSWVFSKRCGFSSSLQVSSGEHDVQYFHNEREGLVAKVSGKAPQKIHRKAEDPEV